MNKVVWGRKPGFKHSKETKKKIGLNVKKAYHKLKELTEEEFKELKK